MSAFDLATSREAEVLVLALVINALLAVYNFLGARANVRHWKANLKQAERNERLAAKLLREQMRIEARRARPAGEGQRLWLDA